MNGEHYLSNRNIEGCPCSPYHLFLSYLYIYERPLFYKAAPGVFFKMPGLDANRSIFEAPQAHRI
jgi:hypothetical protein